MKEDVFRTSLGKANDHKVLPVSDLTSSSSSSSSSSLSSSSNADDQQQCRPPYDQKEDRSIIKGEINSKSKTLSRMKELLKWAAAAKSDRAKFGRKVLRLRNKSATIKTGELEDGFSNNESPKISLKWEVESCDTAASAPPSINYDESYHRTGSWITTDDEFVVLEL